MRAESIRGSTRPSRQGANSLLEWSIRCTYGPGALARRDGALTAHEQFLVAHRNQIRFAGPMFADNGEARTGTWFLIDAPDRTSAETFIAGEGFNRAGMFGEIEIKRFIDTSPEERRQVDIAADRALQMFICECIEGPIATETRKPAGKARGGHPKMPGGIVVRGASVSDDGSAALGTIAIVEVENRAVADALVAADPFLRAGAHRRVRIDRWRFGKSVV